MWFCFEVELAGGGVDISQENFFLKFKRILVFITFGLKGKMSEFLHTRRYLDRGDIVVLDCDTQCNFFLVDDNNFNRYKRDESYEYPVGGGFFKYFPAKIVVPSTGYWNAVVDLGGGSANIKYNIHFVTK